MGNRPTPTQRASASQVGILMKHYRETADDGRGRTGITQSELLNRMAEADPDYLERFRHATVSRWESGGTAPTKERLVAFAKALNLSDDQLRGLTRLVGIDPELQAARQMTCPNCSTQTLITTERPLPHANDRRVRTVRSKQCTTCGFKGTTVERWRTGPEQAVLEKLGKEINKVASAASRAQQALRKQAGRR